ncbi:bifunctional DedA family/phosphatase PAP2 family protein [Tropicimonas sp. IMCC34043]|uniref:bifunctional DedA family/phosphatase PAP2 family protein n=1 Tax=Tropicimonas sp. IMCC34043 TaxID=2248760 RepID=UPI000E25A423|nr:bifunctional DedA family/phosphatase PAP2 family protein [Tropicimonas sp. IMCC34043]
MPHSIDQILPSLQAFGVGSYWLIGLASALEAYFLTGVVVPGTLIVDAGGVLVQRGLLDFFDLAWFVALGSVLGSEAGYWTGRLAMHRVPGTRRIERSKAFARAEALFQRRGGLALVLGRFLGPLAGLVPLVAGAAGMERRRFLIWNLAGSIPYALVHVGIGYFLGDVAGRISGSFTRIALLTGVVAFLLVVVWGLLFSVVRLMPLTWSILEDAAHAIADRPAVAGWIGAHRGIAGWVRARFDRASFTGMPLTVLGLVFVYIASVWLDSIVDFLLDDPVRQLDMRLAELIHHFQSPGPIRLATRITALGSWQVVWPLMAAAVLWLLSARRRALALGLVVSVLGSTLSVALLKMVFQRPRSPLGYFLETSNSFPSGHAAASVGFYGMLMFVLWRAGRLRAETALLGAGLAAFAIGVSRIYLIEHYLSDVVNGWLVGCLWVLVAIAVTEWLSARDAPAMPVAPARAWLRPLCLGAAAMLLCLAVVSAWRYDHPLNLSVVASADWTLSDIGGLAVAEDFPAGTESLLGSELQPIGVIVLAKDTGTVTRALVDAGWTAAARPSPGMVFDAMFAALEGREDPTAEIVAHFWRGQPNDIAFQTGQGPAGMPLGQAYRARFWASDYVTSQGLRVFAGAVGVDEGAEAGSTVAGDLAARDRLVSDLLASGATLATRLDLRAATQVPEGAMPDPPRHQAIVVTLP